MTDGHLILSARGAVGRRPGGIVHRLEPDREHVLADASMEPIPDLPPDVQIFGGWGVEARADACSPT